MDQQPNLFGDAPSLPAPNSGAKPKAAPCSEVLPPPHPAPICDTIEEAEAAAPAEVPTTYTDDQLLGAGIIPVRAFVRSQASANALRMERKRERAAAQGQKQLNVVAPADTESRDALKAVAVDLKEGRIKARDLVAIVGALRGGGWRAALIRKALRV